MRSSVLSLVVLVALTWIGGYLLTGFIEAYPLRIIAMCGINIILAVSLNLVNGFTGQFSMGHAGFMAVGAYVAAALTTLVVPAVLSNAWLSGGLGHLTLLVSLLAGGAAAALVGLMVGIPSLRLRGDYLAIVTLGFGEIIRIVILNIDAVGGARGFYGIPPLTSIYWILGSALLVILFCYRIVTSVPGKQFMAVRDDETATLAMGLSTTRIKVRAFLIASFFAGIAGGLFAHYDAFLNPSTFHFNYSFQVIAMVVLGGSGSLTGSIVAAILLTVLLEALRSLQDLTGTDFRMVIYSLILVVIMLTRPSGMFGANEIWTLWRRWRSKTS
jgi:branched-chain amino acid transport system permease protein